MFTRIQQFLVSMHRHFSSSPRAGAWGHTGPIIGMIKCWFMWAKMENRGGFWQHKSFTLAGVGCSEKLRGQRGSNLTRSGTCQQLLREIAVADEIQNGRIAFREENTN